jgi:hypothetical protein
VLARARASKPDSAAKLGGSWLRASTPVKGRDRKITR